MDTYYLILDLDMVGKMEKGRYPRVWDPDKKDWSGKSVLLMDRIIGYDKDRIGASNMMSRIKEISEDEAMEMIKQ